MIVPSIDLMDGNGDDPGALGGKLLGLLSKFSANFAAMIDGRASNTNQHHHSPVPVDRVIAPPVGRPYGGPESRRWRHCR